MAGYVANEGENLSERTKEQMIVLFFLLLLAVAEVGGVLPADIDEFVANNLGQGMATSFRDLVVRFPYLGEQKHSHHQLELMAHRFVVAAKQARTWVKASSGVLPGVGVGVGVEAAAASEGAKKHPLLCVHFLMYSAALIEHVSRNIKSAEGWCTHWALVFFFGEEDLIREFKEQQKSVIFAKLYRMNTAAEQPSTLTFVAKPLMYQSLKPLLGGYEHVWMLDVDISLQDFRFDDYFLLVRCLGALVSQPLIMGHSQSMPVLNRDFWNDEFPEWPHGFLSDPKRGSPVAVGYRYIEQQVPVFDAAFFAWFIDRAVAPLSESYKAMLETDWGLDDIWCRAAREYAGIMKLGSSDPCGIVLSTPLIHLGEKLQNSSIQLKHSHSLGAHWRFHFAGFVMRLVIREAFPHWFEWEIDDESLRTENYTSFTKSQYKVYYRDQC